MKKITLLGLIIVIVAISTSTIQSQTINHQWSNAMGSTGATGNDGAQAVATDLNGNVYITGYFSGTVDFDNGAGITNLTSSGAYDVFLAKYSSSGALIWANKFGSTSNDVGYGLAVDSNGNSFVTGYFTGTVDFDPSASTLTIASNGSSVADAFISKYDNAGNLVWAKSFSGPQHDQPFGIALDNAGNVYSTGYFQGVVDFDPASATTYTLNSTGITAKACYISKLDVDGNHIFTQAFTNITTGSAIGTSLKVDSYQNIFITGFFTGTVDFDPTAGVLSKLSNDAEDIFVGKINAAGTLNWMHTIGAPNGFTSPDKSNALEIDNLKNVYITGQYGRTVDFDPGVGTTSLTSNLNTVDVFIEKFDSTGAFVWVQGIGTNNFDAGLALAKDINNNLYVGGQFRGNTDFDNGAGTTMHNSAGLEDVFVMKLSSAGTFVWANRIGGASSEYVGGLAVNYLGDLYFAGNYATTCDFDFTAATLNYTAAGGRDLYLAKWGQCTAAPVAPISINGVTTACEGTTTTYSVSIGTDTYSYTWSYPATWSGNSVSNSISATVGNTSGLVSVTANNACGNSSVVTKSVTATPLPVATSIVGNTTVCQGVVNTYSIAPVNGATSYTWGIPGTWTGSSVTNSISLTPSAQDVNISVVATNSCGTSTPEYLAITSLVTPTTPTFVGSPTSVCSGTSVTYSITPLADVSTYSWSTPSGWNGNSTSNTITLSVGTTDGTIQVTASNSCGTSTNSVNATVFLTPSVNVSDASTCVGTSANLSATTTSGLLDWYGLPTGNMVLGSGTNFSTPPVFGNTTYYVQANNNGCTTTPARIPVNVTVNPNPSTTINQAGLTLSTGQNSATYQWLDCNNANTPISGETNQSFTAITNGSYAVEVNLNGCVDTSNCLSINGIGIKEVSTLEGVTIYPNPTSGKFSIKLGNKNTKVLVEIVNVVGEIIYSSNEIETDNLSLDLNLQEGVYFIKVINVELQKMSVSKLVKQ